MSIARWVDLEEDGLALFDEQELAVTYYLAVEQYYYVDPLRRLLDSHPLTVELSNLIESAYPDIIRDPSSGLQLRPLEELQLVRSEVAITNHWFPQDDTPTAKLARDVRAGTGGTSVKFTPEDTEEALNELPASVFAVTIYLDALVATHPELQSSFRPYCYIRSLDDIDGQILSVALEDAFMFASSWAHHCYKLMRNAVQVFSPKVLDVQIPYAIRRPALDLDLAAGEITNSHRLRVIAAETSARSSNDVKQFSEADFLGPLEGFISAMLEAESALNRGLYRSASIMSATASEFIINTLLQLLHWEDGVKPDDGADTGDTLEGIQARVKSKFSPLLGGNWDLTRDGPLKNWAQSVAELRNLIVHAGYLPSEDEARGSIRHTYALQVELADRVMSQRNIGKYARTAYILAGGDGLERRSRRTKRVRELQNSSTEPDWRRSSMEWIEQHGHCLRASRVGWRDASESESDIILVVRSLDRKIAVVEHAPTLGWARQVPDPGDVLSGFPETATQNLVERSAEGPMDFECIKLIMPPQFSARSIGPRVPAFRLVPNSRLSPRWRYPVDTVFVSLSPDFFRPRE